MSREGNQAWRHREVGGATLREGAQPVGERRVQLGAGKLCRGRALVAVKDRIVAERRAVQVQQVRDADGTVLHLYGRVRSAPRLTVGGCGCITLHIPDRTTLSARQRGSHPSTPAPSQRYATLPACRVAAGIAAMLCMPMLCAVGRAEQPRCPEPYAEGCRVRSHMGPPQPGHWRSLRQRWGQSGPAEKE